MVGSSFGGGGPAPVGLAGPRLDPQCGMSLRDISQQGEHGKMTRAV